MSMLYKRVFYVGAAGFVICGMALDSGLWWLALIGVILFGAVGAFGYMHLEASDLEPLKVQEGKQRNREETFRNWMRSTEVVCMKADIWRCHNE